MIVRKAVVDVGSNSVLLLVAERTVNGWTTICETSAVTGIGKGTKSSRKLDPEGATRTLEALLDAKQRATERGATSFEAVGTMALRIAEDAPLFLARAAAQGTPVTVISGPEEAELGFLAVQSDPLFQNAHPLAIIDPGGHSTELVVSGEGEPFRHSYPVGALGLRENTLRAESPDNAARFRASHELDQLLEATAPPSIAASKFPDAKVVALGATGTNMISIRERYETWQPDKVHGAELTYEELSRSVSWLFEMTDDERAHLVGIEKGREKTLHIGCLILERFLYAIRAESCVVSVRGWRHAYLERE